MTRDLLFWPSILSFALLYLSIVNGQKSFAHFHHSKRPLWLKERYQSISQTWKDKKLAALVIKSLTGHEFKRLTTEKESLRKLGLLHILTPSGLHLSLFTKIFRYLPHWSHLNYLLLLFFLLPGLFSLKRMLLLKQFNKVFNLKTSFFLMFLFDLLRGSYAESPLSYSFSFLFLAIVISQPKKLWLHFFLANLIICFFLKNSISIVAIFLAPLFTFFFTLTFPFIVLTLLSPLSFVVHLCYFVIQPYFGLLFYFTSFPIENIHVSLLTIVCFLLYLIFKNKMALIGVLLWINPLNFEQPNLSIRLPRNIYSKKTGICKVQLKRDLLKYQCKKKASRRKPFKKN